MKREKRTAKGGNDANNVCDHLLASADFKVYFAHHYWHNLWLSRLFFQKVCDDSRINGEDVKHLWCLLWSRDERNLEILYLLISAGTWITNPVWHPEGQIFSSQHLSDVYNWWCMCVDVWTTQAYSHIVCRLKQLMQRQLKTTASCWNNQYFSASWAPGGKQHCVSFMLTSVFFQHMPCELL